MLTGQFDSIEKVLGVRVPWVISLPYFLQTFFHTRLRLALNLLQNGCTLVVLLYKYSNRSF